MTFDGGTSGLFVLKVPLNPNQSIICHSL